MEATGLPIMVALAYQRDYGRAASRKLRQTSTIPLNRAGKLSEVANTVAFPPANARAYSRRHDKHLGRQDKDLRTHKTTLIYIGARAPYAVYINGEIGFLKLIIPSSLMAKLT